MDNKHIGCIHNDNTTTTSVILSIKGGMTAQLQQEMYPWALPCHYHKYCAIAPTEYPVLCVHVCSQCKIFPVVMLLSVAMLLPVVRLLPAVRLLPVVTLLLLLGYYYTSAQC